MSTRETVQNCSTPNIDGHEFAKIQMPIKKRPIFHPYLIYFHRQIQGIKSFRNAKQAARLVCGKP